MVVTFELPYDWNTTTCNQNGACNRVKIYTCMTFSAPPNFFPITRFVFVSNHFLISLILPLFLLLSKFAKYLHVLALKKKISSSMSISLYKTLFDIVRPLGFIVKFLSDFVSLKSNPIAWGCRIHQLHLCRVIRESPSFQTSVLDMTLNNLMVRLSNAGALGNVEYPFIAITSRSTLARNVSTWKGPIYDSNRTVWHLNCVQTNEWMFNWIVSDT